MPGVTTAQAGRYHVSIVNSFGGTNSAEAVLTVLTLPEGSYAATVLDTKPLVYYRFSAATGDSAFNLGTLGVANAATYEGAWLSVPGPHPPAFATLEPSNLAVGLDGSTADVAIPALNLDTNSGPNVTMAALDQLRLDPAGRLLRHPLLPWNRGCIGVGGSSRLLDWERHAGLSLGQCSL